MKTNLILLSFLLAVINCFAAKTPNIILILADDMGPGGTQSYGRARTDSRLGSNGKGRYAFYRCSYDFVCLYTHPLRNSYRSL
jgi:hypothetical protein